MKPSNGYLSSISWEALKNLVEGVGWNRGLTSIFILLEAFPILDHLKQKLQNKLQCRTNQPQVEAQVVDFGGSS